VFVRLYGGFLCECLYDHATVFDCANDCLCVCVVVCVCLYAFVCVETRCVSMFLYVTLCINECVTVRVICGCAIWCI